MVYNLESWQETAGLIIASAISLLGIFAPSLFIWMETGNSLPLKVMFLTVLLEIGFAVRIVISKKQTVWLLPLGFHFLLVCSLLNIIILLSTLWEGSLPSSSFLTGFIFLNLVWLLTGAIGTAFFAFSLLRSPKTSS